VAVSAQGGEIVDGFVAERCWISSVVDFQVLDAVVVADAAAVSVTFECLLAQVFPVVRF